MNALIFLFLSETQRDRAEVLLAAAPWMLLGAREVTGATGAYADYNGLKAVSIRGALANPGAAEDALRATLRIRPDLLDPETPTSGTATFWSPTLEADDTCPYAIVPPDDLALLFPQPEPEGEE